jgi:hypothetical protein
VIVVYGQVARAKALTGRYREERIVGLEDRVNLAPKIGHHHLYDLLGWRGALGLTALFEHRE